MTGDALPTLWPMAITSALQSVTLLSVNRSSHGRRGGEHIGQPACLTRLADPPSLRHYFWDSATCRENLHASQAVSVSEWSSRVSVKPVPGDVSSPESAFRPRAGRFGGSDDRGFRQLKNLLGRESLTVGLQRDSWLIRTAARARRRVSSPWRMLAAPSVARFGFGVVPPSRAPAGGDRAGSLAPHRVAGGRSRRTAAMAC